jgi:hypothetical protein
MKPVSNLINGIKSHSWTWFRAKDLQSRSEANCKNFKLRYTLDRLGWGRANWLKYSTLVLSGRYSKLGSAGWKQMACDTSTSYTYVLGKNKSGHTYSRDCCISTKSGCSHDCTEFSVLNPWAWLA